MRSAKSAINRGSVAMWTGYRNGKIVWCEKRFGIDLGDFAFACVALVPVAVFGVEWRVRGAKG